jgi:hypothetical protein
MMVECQPFVSSLVTLSVAEGTGGGGECLIEI